MRRIIRGTLFVSDYKELDTMEVWTIIEARRSKRRIKRMLLRDARNKASHYIKWEVL